MTKKKFKPAIINTDGKGRWSTVAKPVQIIQIQVEMTHKNFGELRALFKVGSGKNEWDTNTDGLIYSDPQWIKEFRNELVKQGIVTRSQANKIQYSEQGMQGDNYVSMDVTPTIKINMSKISKVEYI